MTPVKNFILILFITCNSIAQTAPFYESYNWETTPSYQIEGLDNDMVAIKDKVVTEFYFEDQNLTEYYLEHKILWLNSDDRIEEYTKVYLPIANDASQVVINARIIKKTGEIIVLDKSRISKESAKNNISVGNTVRFSDNVNREIPANWPDFSCASVCNMKSPR